jgi:hypothetical protein
MEEATHRPQGAVMTDRPAFDEEELMTISIDQARAFIEPMLHSEDEGIRLCAGSVWRAINGLLKKVATARAEERERCANILTPALFHGFLLNDATCMDSVCAFCDGCGCAESLSSAVRIAIRNQEPS